MGTVVSKHGNLVLFGSPGPAAHHKSLWVFNEA